MGEAHDNNICYIISNVKKYMTDGTKKYGTRFMVPNPDGTYRDGTQGRKTEKRNNPFLNTGRGLRPANRKLPFSDRP